MQTTMNEVATDVQATYPQCVKEIKFTNRAQALFGLLIAVVLLVIYTQQPDKDTTFGLIQIALIAVFMVLGVFKLFVGSSKLIYVPTGGVVEKHSYVFNVSLQSDILRCLEEGNTARLKALKTDDAGGLLVELLESEEHLFIAACLFKYEPHGYEAKTDWVTMKR